MKRTTTLPILLLILVGLQASFANGNWPRFHGAGADGVGGDDPGLPTTWSTTENVKWVADIPGWGWSSPIVWGDRLFLTTVVGEEENVAPSKGLYLGKGVREPAKGTHHWLVYCFDLNSGKELWKQEAHVGEPQVPRHPKSTYAAETAATDGERLYVLFGDLGLYCYDLDGQPLWSRSIEPQKTFFDYGAAASPVVHDGQVFVVYDNLESSWIASFDAKTGDQRWKKTRDETHSWATPFVWENDLRTELVVPGKNLNRSYSLDGEVLWEFDGDMSNLVIPSPFAAHGMCYIASGYVGDAHRPTFAVKPGAKGDIAPEGDFAESEFIEWYQGTSSSYNPSQIVYGDYLYTLYDQGFLTCHDAKTGEEVYGKQRFSPGGSFTSSPIAYNGHIFCLSEDGLTYVVKAGREFEIVSRNELDELCLACPAVVGDMLLIRTASKLYCLTDGVSLERSENTVVRLPDAVSAKTNCLNPDFLLYLPKGYEAAAASPLMIFLHGRGERGTDIERIKVHGPPKLIERGEDFPFIVVSPQCLTKDDGKGWWDTSDLNLLLEHLTENYKIDRRRIYLTGLSMGGFATWAWSIDRPQTFAAIAPICGGGEPAKAEQIAHLPAWVFHGARDGVVPIERSQAMVAALKEHGSKVKFTIYPDAGHDSWTESYNNEDLYEWFLEQTLLPAEQSKDDVPANAFERIMQELHSAVDSGEVAGAAHMVVHRGQEVFYQEVGVRDIEDQQPLQRDTILRFYSMSKPITSVAAMTLYEQGKFKLDDPVAKYIPAFEKTMVLEKDGDGFKTVPAKRQITVRDVFRHTTGYAYGGNGNPELEQKYRSEGMKYRPPAAMMPPDMTIEQAADALARIPALHHPGEKFTYGFSTDLLGRLIEVWSGKSLDQYVRQSVIEPLEMVDTGFAVPEDRRDRFASCHTWRDGKLAIVDNCETSPFATGFKFLSGGGGLVSTIQDYAKFCQMMVSKGQYKGKRILQPATVQLMFTDQMNGVGGGFQFGLGFAIAEVTIGSGDSSRQAKQYSWGGYASTDFRLVPDEDLFQIFVRQRVPSSHQLASRMMKIAYEGVNVEPGNR